MTVPRPIARLPRYEPYNWSVRVELPEDAPFGRELIIPIHLLRVWQGLARGMSNEEISAACYIAPKTVKNYLFTLYRLLGVTGLPNPRVRAAVLGWYLMRDYPELTGYQRSNSEATEEAA